MRFRSFLLALIGTALFVPEIFAFTASEMIALCKNGPWDDQCLPMAEKMQLTTFADRAWRREDGTLSILLSSGGVMNFSNSRKRNYEDKDFHFLDYLSTMGYFVIVERYFERGVITYNMVNQKNGKTFKLSGFPLVSPDFERVAAFPDCVLSYLSYENIEIWRLKEDEQKQEWRFQPKCCTTGAEWVDGRTIQFKKIARDGTLKKTGLRVKLKKRDWGFW